LLSEAGSSSWPRETVLAAKTLHMKVDYNPYEGRRVKGAADLVMSRGKVIVENGKFLGRAGDGVFLKRAGRAL